jgi:DNA-binding NtrC family response regulator
MPVLIIGETGAGKALVARAVVFAEGPRISAADLQIDVAGGSESILWPGGRAAPTTRTD